MVGTGCLATWSAKVALEKDPEAIYVLQRQVMSSASMALPDWAGAIYICQTARFAERRLVPLLSGLLQ